MFDQAFATERQANRTIILEGDHALEVVQAATAAESEKLRRKLERIEAEYRQEVNMALRGMLEETVMKTAPKGVNRTEYDRSCSARKCSHESHARKLVEAE